jgi:branched-chain amino acid transport system substrate-binding protein
MQDIFMNNKKILWGAALLILSFVNGSEVTTNTKCCSVTPINSKFLVKVDLFFLIWWRCHEEGVGHPNVKVAIVAEKAAWADPMVGLQRSSKMGWKWSGLETFAYATDTTSELSAIQRGHIIFTTFSLGGDSACQASRELKIPARSQESTLSTKDGWDATGGKGTIVSP